MAGRYTEEVLLNLRLSPLCVRPPTLSPADEWMGPPPELLRTPKTAERPKSFENALVDQTNRRQGLGSRNNANPEDIILGPPRTSFASSTTRLNNKTGENDKATRDQEPRDRFNNLRVREADSLDDRGGDRLRDGRTNFRRRDDRDQDSDGWSTVRPRKSFGHEGAERFQHGRAAFRAEHFRDDRKQTRDNKDDPDSTKDRPRRNFDGHGRDRDGEDNETSRWNGLNRNRTDPWSRDNNHEERDRGDRGDRGENRGDRDRPSQRERIDRAKSWRDRAPDDHPRERNSDRNYDRRLDRDRDGRVEREPEWLDEPAGEKAGGRTEEDFKKFMESMKAGKGGAKKPENGKASPEDPSTANETSPADQDSTPSAESAPQVNSGPDKFFLNFAASAALGGVSAEGDVKKDSAQSKAAKSSRFTSFFSAQPQAEPAATAAIAGPPMSATPLHLALGLNTSIATAPLPDTVKSATVGQADVAEKQAFMALLQKLQRQTLQSPSAASPPGTTPVPETPPVQLHQQQAPPPSQKLPHQIQQQQQQLQQQPPPQQPQQQQLPPHLRAQPPLQSQQQHVQQPLRPQQQQQQQTLYPQQQQQHHQLQLQHVLQDTRQKPAGISPDVFQQYGGDRRGPQGPMQDLGGPRPISHTQPPVTRPEQMLQELVEQRHHTPTQGGGREMTPQGNSQTEFLMKLMQRARAEPEPRRTEELLMQMPQPQKQAANLPMLVNRELDFQRERGGSGSQQRPMQPPVMPGMYEDQFHRPDGGDVRLPRPQGQPQPQQPTQILQRPPPGLDHQLHPGFMPGGGQVPPPGQQRGPMIPPPGLVGGPGGPGGLGGPGGPNLPVSPNRHIPGMFPPNFPHGVFPPVEGLAGPPRMQPPPGFFGGPPLPPGHPAFMPPPGLAAFQGGPDGMPFGTVFDGRGMPPPPGAGGQFRRP
ncbi:hypothetical protein RB593_008710 [Gaeumannomyces tritici]